MGDKRKPAREAAQLRDGGEIWIDHAVVREDDGEWLGDVEWLTLWNVTTPPGFLATLPALWGVDLRGGSAADLAMIDGCSGLRCLIVNQVRGMRDLAVLTTLKDLELLELYGLTQVVSAPSLRELGNLRRLEVGQMRGLDALASLLDAPALEELLLNKWVNVTTDDVERITTHPTLERFFWFAADVPLHRQTPVIEAIDLPSASSMFPRDWFRARGQS